MSQQGRPFFRILESLYGSFCRSIYGYGAPCYDTVAEVVSLGHWGHWLALALDRVPPGRVLELGFGTGRLQKALGQRKDIEAFGLDLSMAMHRITRKRLGTCHRSTQRVLGDGTRIPFCSEAFDTLVATFPESYLAEVSTLRECCRVLKKDGGRMIVVGQWLELKSTFWQGCIPVFYRPFGEDAQKRMFQRAAQAGLECTIERVELNWVIHHVIHLRPR